MPLDLVGNGSKPATMAATVRVPRALQARRGHRAAGPLTLRPQSGKPIDRRNIYRMVRRIAKTAGIPKHTSPALTARTPASHSATRRSSPDTPTHAPPSTTTEPAGNLDRHGVHFLTAYVAGV